MELGENGRQVTGDESMSPLVSAGLQPDAR